MTAEQLLQAMADETERIGGIRRRPSMVYLLPEDAAKLDRADPSGRRCLYDGLFGVPVKITRSPQTLAYLESLTWRVERVDGPYGGVTRLAGRPPEGADYSGIGIAVTDSWLEYLRPGDERAREVARIMFENLIDSEPATSLRPFRYAGDFSEFMILGMLTRSEAQEISPRAGREIRVRQPASWSGVNFDATREMQDRLVRQLRDNLDSELLSSDRIQNVSVALDDACARSHLAASINTTPGSLLEG